MSQKIEGYVGRRGRGKTYTVVARVLKSYKRYTVVAANLRIDVPNLLTIEGPQDMLPGGAIDKVRAAYCLAGFYAAGAGSANGRRGRRFRPAPWRVLCVVDEAHIWFPSRQSQRLPISIMEFFSQTRKIPLDLLWTAQRAERVDRALRDNTDWIWKAEAWFRALTLSDRPLFYTARAFEPEDLGKKNVKAGPMVVRPFRWKVARAYETTEKQTASDHIAAIADFYTNPKESR